MEKKSQPRISLKKKTVAFIKKYFLEGQKLDDHHLEKLANLPKDASFGTRLMVKHRRLVGFLIPFLFFQLLYFTLAIRWNLFRFWKTHYQMGLAMLVGATVAGMTSEGGGAVAYPVLTLGLNTTSEVGRDFSLMCQSAGMTTAAFTILWMKIKVEHHAVIFCGLGGLFGIVTGLEVVDPALSGSVKKLTFVSVWFSFAFALFLLNREKKRVTFDLVPNFGVWQAITLLLTGFIGGIFSGVAGSGLDLCSFSILTLLFRVTEKVATPTSVVLMATNTVIGFFWRQLMTDTGCELEAWHYLVCAVPVCATCGPIGAVLSSHFHRQVQATMIYVLDTLALITALVVLPMTWQLGTISLGIIAGGFIFFYLLSRAGQRLLRHEINRGAAGTIESCIEMSDSYSDSDNNNNDNDDNTNIIKGNGVVVSFIEAVHARRDEKGRGDGNAPEVYSLLSSV